MAGDEGRIVSPRSPTRPLLAAAADDTVAWRDGRAVPAREFLAHARALADRLPAQGPMVNLCTDRYAFAVGFAAALMQGHASLLPPNALGDTLAGLRESHPGLYALTDDEGLDVAALELVRLRRGVELAPAADAAGATVPQVRVDLQAAYLLTSGSTGVPQPHTKDWGSLVENIRAESQRLAQFLGREDLRGLGLVATVPPQHSYGFESSVLLPMLGGAAFDAGRPFYPADIVRALERLPRPRGLITTPFHLKALLLAGIALPPVDAVLSATAALSPQLAQLAERSFGGTLVEIYGCTEAGQVATRRTAQTDLWTTFGELRIHAQTDAQGEERFLVQGGHVSEPTPLADVLQLEAPTRFRLLGRANDLIKVAGRRSSLAHLNYHLNSIDGVQDGSFWLPDDVPDDVVRPIAFVVAPGLSAAQIVAALRERVESVFVPRRVVHVASLPREATGKLTARSLREFALAHLPTGATR